MSEAYLDSSVFLAIVLEEPSATGLRGIVERYDRIVSSDLIVAEGLAVASREAVRIDRLLTAFRMIHLVCPNRSLVDEILEANKHAYLRGADLRMDFLSRDRAQRRVASQLGFETP